MVFRQVLAHWRNTLKLESSSRASVPETKASATARLLAYHRLGAPIWAPRDYASLARNGFERNVIAHRCIRLIAEAAASAPLRLYDSGHLCTDHPVLRLLKHPNPSQSGPEFLESVFGYLQTAGNAYIESVEIDGDIRELHILRPDRMKVRLGNRGWIDAYEYVVNGRRHLFHIDEEGRTPILHLKLFHPTHDQYGFSPLEAASASVDIHNAASDWNKSLLDNAARPSGALVYSGPDGAENLTADQFDRLKSELEDAYTGQSNAGKPLLLDGGLDWRPMSLSPADMDFIEAKNNAAREIALAFGVPPMLLGIPGDNTYANYREANLAFWRQTILPLAQKVAAALSRWLLQGAENQGQALSLRCDASDLEALSSERDALWRRVSQADFLSEPEKRQLLGLSQEGSCR